MIIEQLELQSGGSDGDSRRATSKQVATAVEVRDQSLQDMCDFVEAD